jgi:long-chain fatty acid transport protein
LILPATVLGAGFSLYENGGRALGMAGALTASVDDATGIFFNPASLVLIEHGEVLGGVSFIFTGRKFAGENPFPGYGVTEESPNKVFTPFHAYWGHRFFSDLAVGFGVYTPFGLAVEWKNPDQFTGRFISTKAAITPFFFNPVIAWALSDRVRVGGGLMAVYSKVELNQHLSIPNPLGPDPDVLDIGKAELSATNSLDFGVNLGVQWDVSKAVALGFNFRNGIPVTYEGDANFMFTGTGVGIDPPVQEGFPRSQKARTQVDFPASAVAAIAYRDDDFILEFDLGWTGWSSFDKLDFVFEDETLNSTRPQNWSDVWFYRVGAEYYLSDKSALRAGYYYDNTPQPRQAISPILPDNDRQGVSLGFGYDWGTWRADLFGLYLLIADRDTRGTSQDNYEGKYANSVGILGATVGFRY